MYTSVNGQPIGDFLAAFFSLVTAVYSASRWRKQLAVQSTNLFENGIGGAIIVTMLLVLGPVLGAILNRIRGGWLRLPLVTGDTERRLLMATPIGVLVYIGNGGGALVSIATSALLFLGEVEGWGCYFSMARGSDCATEPDRFGMFDFLLGRANPDYTFDCRWLRDAAAMGLRGLVWMLPPGIIWYSLRFISDCIKSTSIIKPLMNQSTSSTFDASAFSLNLCAGAFMAVIYEAGNHIHIFEPLFQGTAVAELLMGYWIYACLITLSLRRCQLQSNCRNPVVSALVSTSFWALVVLATSGLALLSVTLPLALSIRLGALQNQCLAPSKDESRVPVST